MRSLNAGCTVMDRAFHVRAVAESMKVTGFCDSTLFAVSALRSLRAQRSQLSSVRAPWAFVTRRRV